MVSESPPKRVPDADGRPEDRSFLRSGNSKGEQVRERRETAKAPNSDFTLVKAVIILPGGTLNYIVFRRVGLNHGPACLAAPSRPAHYLGQQAEGPFRCPVILQVQRKIGGQYAHQGHIFKIQPLGHHLGAKQDGNTLLLKAAEQFLVSFRRGIRVHPQDPRAGKQVPQLLLHLLRPCPYPFHNAAASRTGVKAPLGMTAVMAHQPPVGGMVGQRSAAPGALRHMPALSAEHIAAAAPAVQKKDALLSVCQILFKLPPETLSDQAGVSGLELLPEIGNQDLGEVLLIIPAAKHRLVILSPLRRPGRLHRRRSGAQNQQCLIPGAEIFCDVPCMIPGRIFRTVAVLLLLIQDDDA